MKSLVAIAWRETEGAPARLLCFGLALVFLAGLALLGCQPDDGGHS